MQFNKLRIRNFLTIGEAELNLANKGLVLIQGINSDDESASSNGAGKSSIADAICWCLFGQTARGVTGDAVVNLKEGKSCSVWLTVQDGDDVFYIGRGRKDGRLKNRLFVETMDDAGQPVDLTKGTDKLTQELVEQIIGCSYEVFAAGIYAGQDAMPDLPGMTDKNLKALIEESAGINRLQAAHEQARERLREHNSKLAQQQLVTVAARNAVETEQGNVQRFSQMKDVFETDRIAKVNLRLQEIENERVKKDKMTMAFDTGRMTEIDAESAALQSALDGHKQEKAEEQRLQHEVSSAQMSAANYEFQARSLADAVKRMKHAAEHVCDMVGTACKECGKPIEESDLEQKQQIANDALAESVSGLRAIKSQLDAARADVVSASKRLSDFQATMTDVSEVIARERVLSSEKAGLIAQQQAIQTIQKGIESLEASLEELKKAENPYISLLSEVQSAVSDTTEKLEKETAAEKMLVADLPLYEAAVQVFSPAGVRAHILDTVTPYLNDRTAHYLGSLSDGNLSAIWSTIAYTAKGEAREKFNIEVTNGTGADQFAGLSGGEKRKVRLACSMALQDLVASRAAKPIELYVADEIDHALDEAGLERLMGILDEKARQRGTVLVISHNDLADWCRQIATVEKVNGKAEITGVLN